MNPVHGNMHLPKNYEGESACLIITHIDFQTGIVTLSDAECYNYDPMQLTIQGQVLIEDWVRNTRFQAPLYTRLYKQSKLRIT